MRMLKLIIVRHCETQGNEQKIFQGNTETPVNSNGYFQLGLLSARLENEKIDAIYSSPQERAITTAKAINEFHNVKIITKNDLREINIGGFEKKNIEQVAKLFPNEARTWNEKFYDFKAPNGESIKEVFKRVSNSLGEIISENDNKTVAVISHGCSIRAMMCYLLGKKLEEIADVPLGTNTAVSIVEIDKNENRVIAMSDTSHLPKKMRNKKHLLFKL